jgi:hypothetical protein
MAQVVKVQVIKADRGASELPSVVQHERSKRSTFHASEERGIVPTSGEPVEVIGNCWNQMRGDADAATTSLRLRRPDDNLAVLEPLARPFDPENRALDVYVPSLKAEQFTSTQPAPRCEKDGHAETLADRIRERVHFGHGRHRPFLSMFDAGALDGAG